MEISRYCLECKKFGKSCNGKKPNNRVNLQTKLKLSGLNFCSRYEFDEKLYKFKADAKADTIKDIRKRQSKKKIEKENQQQFDDFDFANSLSSSDFADFL